MRNRTVTAAFRSMGQVNGTTLRPVALSARMFSTTPAYGVSAIFTETDNVELNKVLNTIQSNITLPAYLPTKQRKIVFDQKLHTYLRQNPIVIEIEGLEHKFSTTTKVNIDAARDMLNDALKHMETREDWNNLGTLLAGYKKAGIPLQPIQWARTVRLAGRSGNIDTIIECAKQSHKTDLVLSQRESVVRLLANLNDRITDSNWDEAETKQALKGATTVLELLQDPAHTSPDLATHDKLHFSRIVRGLVLFARSSVVKVKQDQGEPIDQDLILLQDEVDLLSTIWKDTATQNLNEVDEFVKLRPARKEIDGYKKVRFPRNLTGSAYVQVLAQNIKGMALAREMLGDGAATGILKDAEANLSTHLDDFGTTYPKVLKGWFGEYEKVMGQPPNWPAASDSGPKAESEDA